MKTNERTRFLTAIVVFMATFAIFPVRTQAQPAITQQPTNQAILLGSAASFSVAVNGTPPYSYQWQFNGTNTTNAGDTLTVPIVHHADLGSYDVIVTDHTGSVTSDVVRLTLLGPRPIITLTTNTPNYNVVSVQYTVAPNASFQLLVTHDLTPPIQWFGPAFIGQSGGASNYNWSYGRATNFTQFYPKTFWRLDPYP